MSTTEKLIRTLIALVVLFLIAFYLLPMLTSTWFVFAVLVAIWYAGALWGIIAI